MKNILFLILLIFGTGQAFAQTHFFRFVDSLFERKEVRESLVIKEALQNADYKFCGNDSLDKIVEKVAYMHMLMTCYYSVDGDTSGGFGIPYFWNYTNHNPRENIINLRKGKTLKELPSAGGSSMATLDRTPLIFWGDFMTEEPTYSYEHISAFYTFGWCSEREMAFKAWLGLVGIKSTMGIRTDHVWMEVELPSMPGYFLFIDNTFNRFEVWPMSKRPKLEVGNKYITWYNQQGADKNIQLKLKNMVISPKRAAVLEHQIINYFTSNADDY